MKIGKGSKILLFFRVYIHVSPLCKELGRAGNPDLPSNIFWSKNEKT